MTTYSVEPERRTLHGHFSRDLPPILTIDPGDSVSYSTLDAAWGLEPSTGIGGAPQRRFEPRVEKLDSGHALCGPVYIRGALLGMTLQVRINELRPGPYGFTWAGGRPSRAGQWLGITDETVLLWTLDADRMLGRNQLGHTVALHPFMGVMGMPPDEPGVHTTTPPRICGGNIDCKELVAGSTLYLPVPVPGGLFSVGDGHAAQGDGEVSRTAIECPMERVDLTFNLDDTVKIATPRADTPAGWITFGFHEDLNEAAMLALEAMIELMCAQYKVERVEALALASIVVDLRVTQIANDVHGVHAVLPHGAIQ